MISEYFHGKDGFIWWHGVVEDRKDPLFLGRCRIRILGWHTENKSDLPTKQLPWAYPLMPITSASQTGVGQAPVGPVEGTWVMGFYRDGQLAQEPVFMGTLHGIPERYARQNTGFYDPRLDVEDVNKNTIAVTGEAAKNSTNLEAYPYPPNLTDTQLISGREAIVAEYSQEERIAFASKSLYPRELNKPTTSKYARGEADSSSSVLTTGIVAYKNDNRLNATIVQNFTPNPNLSKHLPDDEFTTLSATLDKTNIDQPASPYKAVYPYNHVYESESGHLIEIDDTPRSERLHWFHRSGTFTEFHPQGTRVDRTVGHRYNMTTGNEETITRGTEKKKISLDSRISVGKTLEITSGKEIKLVSEDGNIIADSPSGLVNISGKHVLIDATENIVLKAGTKIVRDDDTAEDFIKGNYAVKSQGEYGVQAGKLTFGSLGATNISSFGSMSQTVVGNSEEIISNVDVVLGNTNAKTIRALLGKIVFETVDAILTGGIDLNVGPSGAAGQLSIKAPLGDIDIKSNTGPNGINIQATTQALLKGLVKAAVQGALVEIKADALCQIDGALVTVGGQSEPMILGKTFLVDVFKDHQHPTSVGPTGPIMPQYAAKIIQSMSKKVFLG